MKTCTECKTAKALEQFYRSAASRDGFSPQCKDCRKKRDRARYLANRVERVEQQRAYRRDNAVAIAKRMKNWYAKMTPAQQKTKLAGNHRWLKNHPEKNANYVAKRRARIANAPVVELIDRTVVYARDGGLCHLCRQPVPADAFHLDHVIPLVKGGEHSYRNVRVACPPCNARKGARCAD